MQVLSPRIDLDAFFKRVASASQRVLMLDYDGTLAPFRVRPEQAAPYPGVSETLTEIISAGGTRVVIVSGRRAGELVPLLGLPQPPEIWGAHGWERVLPSGEHRTDEPNAAARARLEEAERRVQELARDGARIERKPASRALHWRGLPALTVAKVREQATERWAPLTQEGEVELLEFDGGLELRASGCNKQHAVKTVLSETGAGSAVAYLGDDTTDEDAFAAVKPRGLAVLVRPEFRPTAADVWLRPPAELIEFLRRWRQRGAA